MKTTIQLFMLLSFSLSTEAAYILCEGDFYSDDATLWIENESFEISETLDNPIGNIGQSITVVDNTLYIILNGTSQIRVYDINESDGSIDFTQSIDTNLSGPRELLVIGDYGYLSEWNTQSISVINMNTYEFISSIPIDGLPDMMVTDGSLIYVSIVLNSDWSDGNTVLAIDPENNSVVNSYNVGTGPGQMVLYDNIIYIARIFYDEYWTQYTGTTSINLTTGEITIQDYGVNSLALCGGDIAIYQGSIYRTWNGGIAMLDENLEIISETRIGTADYESVYSMATNGDLIYLGISEDFMSPDEVVVLDSNSNEVARHTVGGIPGSFAFWNTPLSISNQIISADEFKLIGNYPNPFNPETTILFYLQETGVINLSVYNILGKVVYQEINTIYSSGNNSFTINLSNQMSGLYFYRFSTDKATTSGKMMLLK